jgi:hypothetical protein
MLTGHSSESQAQQGESRPQALVSKVRVDKPNDAYTGPLYATINGKEKKLAEPVIEAWVIDGGRKVAYSMRDGAGGFEDEGESLRVYDAETGKIKKVLSEYFSIDGVTEVKTASGKVALLVKMSDGGLGADYLAVVDPLRGEVFFKRWVRLLSRKGDIINIGHYREDDWSEFLENKNAKVRPYKTEQYNLSALLKRRVIVNKRDRPF